MSQPKVSFGFVNCNRLHYLRSCVESFLLCTEDYKNKEILVVDNASTEDGTDEYLEELRDRGFKVYKQKERDPSNEYARALNILAENSTGDYVAMIPADVQFVIRGGWLNEYVEFFQKFDDTTGCVSFDAQRTVRNQSGVFSNILGDDFKFTYHYNRPPVMGAMNCMISKETLQQMAPWSTNNDSHEGGQDSETKMLKKMQELFKSKGTVKYYASGMIPVSIGIFNEQGGNARVRGDLRYGDYWTPPNDPNGVLYYEIHDYETLVEVHEDATVPVGIEEIAISNGWKLPIDDHGQWIKLKSDPNLVGAQI
ncbi:MAG: glycosyltransferase family 2 protein [Candidatus Peribacter sp.]|jgi:glycosyltransferase involved in cell wall biosynthesis|nr:glycosyltransferase family 2 protein [Candidatus Peribacter sp.]